jgi:hypothetical protein
MSPTSYRTAPPRVIQTVSLDLVGLGRFELPTSRLSGVRSNQLSYRPSAFVQLFLVAKKSHTFIRANPFSTADSNARDRVASVASTLACDLLLDLPLLQRTEKLLITDLWKLDRAHLKKTSGAVPTFGLSFDTQTTLLDRFWLSVSVVSFRKEVIQPQVLLQLPCYDFTPIMDHTVTTCLSCELALPLLVQPTFVM